MCPPRVLLVHWLLNVVGSLSLRPLDVPPEPYLPTQSHSDTSTTPGVGDHVDVFVGTGASRRDSPSRRGGSVHRTPLSSLTSLVPSDPGVTSAAYSPCRDVRGPEVLFCPPRLLSVSFGTGPVR